MLQSNTGLKMTDTKYNGWTNYATWRVNLEMFDGVDLEYLGLTNNSDNPHGAYELGEFLKDYAEERMNEDAPSDSLALSYAMAFLSDVNWSEIAQRIVDDETVGA
jgi:hypothetical protein